MAPETTTLAPDPILRRARAGTNLAVGDDGVTVVSRNKQQLSLERPSPGRLGALKALLEGGGTDREVSAHLAEASVVELAAWFWTLRQLQGLHIVEYVLVQGDLTLAALVPSSDQFQLDERPLDPTVRYGLSSFASMRLTESGFLVSTPLSHAHVVLHQEAAHAFGVLGAHVSLAEFAASSSLDEGQAAALLLILRGAAIVSPVDEAGVCELDRRAQALGWSVSDASFHFSTRIGRTVDHWFGAKPEESRDPSPPLPGPRKGEAALIPLRQPDPAQLAAVDPSLAEVMSSRRSIRTYGDSPISTGELGEFLFRVARIQNQGASDGNASLRPHPSGGGCYPLEIYVAAESCAGLEAGLYRYDPLEHGLGKINVSAERLNRIVEPSRRRGVDHFQVLFLITARLTRLSWKYETIPYSIVLKDVGALFQSMYLAATAMNLAPCAIGIGHSDLLPNAIGLDALEETTVGEFALGSTG